MEATTLAKRRGWSRRRALTIGGASAIAILAASAWAWMILGSTGLSVTAPGVPLPGGELLLSLQTIPFQVDGKGTLIAGGGGLWGVDPRTGSNRRKRGGLIEQARVSPDGRWIVYRDDHFRTWIEPLGGGDRRQVPIDSGKAVWAPDSRSIVASDYRNVSTRAETVRQFLGHLRFRVADLAVERLAIPDSTIIEDWSPDDRWIVTMPLDGGQIVLRSVDGRESRPVTPDPRSWGHRFSPDGRRIAFLRPRPPGPSIPVVPDELCLIGVEGAGLQNLRDDLPEAQSLCWSPDGSAILVKQHRSISIVRLDGELVPIPLSVRKPFLLFDPKASFDPDPLYVGTAEWLPAAGDRKK